MRRYILPLLAPLMIVASPVYSQEATQNDSDYLQQRAASLNNRIDMAVKKRRISKKKAAGLRVSVGRVQTLAGNLQTRNGTINRPDADRMNQKLTDVERILTNQP